MSDVEDWEALDNDGGGSDDWEALAEDKAPKKSEPIAAPEPVKVAPIEAPMKAKKKKALALALAMADRDTDPFSSRAGATLDAYSLDQPKPEPKKLEPAPAPAPKKKPVGRRKEEDAEVENWEDISDKKIEKKMAKLEDAMVAMTDACVVTAQRLLRWRFVGVAEDDRPPDDIQGFRSLDQRIAFRQPCEDRPVRQPGYRGWQNQPNNASNEDRQWRRSEPLRLIRSERAYVVRSAQDLSREEALRRQVKGMINKITVETFSQLTDSMGEVQLESAGEIELVANLVFDKAITEHHFGELYADMCKGLVSRYPEFPPTEERPYKMTFSRALIDRCQEEFEKIPPSLEPTARMRERFTTPEDLELEVKRQKDRVLGNMKFIGQLFLRRLITHKVVMAVIQQLVFNEEEEKPEAHYVECLCALIRSIGASLEDAELGKKILSDFTARMREILEMDYSKRIKFQVQDVLDLQQNRWEERNVIDKARTIKEVHDDANRERQDSGGKGHGKGKKQKKNSANAGYPAGGGEPKKQLAGMRPQYIQEQMDAEIQTKRKERSKGSRARADGVEGEEDLMEQVRKVYSYFVDSWDLNALEEDWRGLSIPEARLPEALRTLLELGFSDHAKAESAASVVVTLVRLGHVSWTLLAAGLGEFGAQLEDLIIDNPRADVFYQTILAHLVMNPGKDRFDEGLLKSLPKSEASFRLLCGVLRLVELHRGIKAEKLALQVMKRTLLDIADVEDTKVLHDRLVAAGVLTDPLRDVMPRLREVLRHGDFSVQSVEDCLRDSLGAVSKVEATVRTEVFVMQFIDEIVAALKVDSGPSSWTERLDQVGELLVRFCGSFCASPFASRDLAIDALMHSALTTHKDLERSEVREILLAICHILNILSQDLKRWCEDPMAKPNEGERKISVAIVREVQEELAGEEKARLR